MLPCIVKPARSRETGRVLCLNHRTRDGWQIQVALGDLDQSRGEQVLAGQAYAQAMSVVQELAEKIENEGLHTHFLTTPQVQHALEQATR